jgi:murein peptide amidase A
VKSRRRRILGASLVGIGAGAALIAVAHRLPGAESPSTPHRRAAAPGPTADRSAEGGRFLDFAVTPPRGPGNVRARIGAAGRSLQGRRIGMRQYGDPALEGELLVFGCVHGDECAAQEVKPLTQITSFCPDWLSDVYVVPNLNPDGLAAESRLNGRGVDLNRNFPSAWRPIGEPGDPQHSGPRPASERETRLAMRIVRRLRPEVTIWFHQHAAARPLVRAWAGSVPAARRFAQLAELPFRRLPWLDGTAPNWQNHAFPGAASFVVELPPGPLSEAGGLRLGIAILRLGRELSED